jgi:hypothetical protein
MPVELSVGGYTHSVSLDGTLSKKVRGSDTIVDGHAYGVDAYSGGGAN